MAESLRHIRIFLSSPSDVTQERKIASAVIEQLPYHAAFRDRITVEAVAWDKQGASTPLLANMTPQEAINQGLPRPSECEIVVVILWSRIGTPLPSQYKKSDGSGYVSGTEWEYLDALESAQKKGSPLIIVYRRNEDPMISLKDPNLATKGKQYYAVEDFFQNFENPDGSMERGYNPYVSPDDFRREFEVHIQTLVTSILNQAVSVSQSPSVKNSTSSWKGSPFPGLRAFTPEDAPIFFGRGRETDALIRRISNNRFVAVVGASGSGKSSLVGAGVVVQLAANALEGSKDWLILRLTPAEIGGNPFTSLAAQLAPFAKHISRDIAAELLSDLSYITQVADEILASRPKWSQLLLFIDQFEELFTLVETEYLEPFTQLLGIIANSQNIRLIVTMRSDFYHRCVDLPILAALLQDGSYPLSTPNQVALYDMITRPADRAALSFEDGLPEQMLEDTGFSAGSLALLAYTLDELYHNREEDGKLTFAAYDLLGGVQGAIGKRAEKTFLALDEEAQSMMPRVFRELVEVDERGTATRQRAQLDRVAFNDIAIRLVDAFTNARLLVKDKNIVEVAHEALLRSWIRLASWIDKMQGDLRLLRQAQISAQEWESRGQRSDYLWSHERLVPVYEMIERLQITPVPTLQSFIVPEYTRLSKELSDMNTLDYRRQAIADRLAQIGEAALSDLFELFISSDKWIRAAAIRAIIQIGKPSIPGLIEYMLQPNSRSGRAARALVAIGHESFDGLLSVYDRTSDLAVRQEVIEAIAALGRTMSPVDLITLFANAKNEHSSYHLIPFLNKLPFIRLQVSDNVLDNLYKRLRSTNTNDVVGSVFILGRLNYNTTSSSLLLEITQQTKNTEVLKLTIQALGSLKEVKAIPFLESVLQRQVIAYGPTLRQQYKELKGPAYNALYSIGTPEARSVIAAYDARGEK